MKCRGLPTGWSGTGKVWLQGEGRQGELASAEQQNLKATVSQSETGKTDEEELDGNPTPCQPDIENAAADVDQGSAPDDVKRGSDDVGSVPGDVSTDENSNGEALETSLTKLPTSSDFLPEDSQKGLKEKSKKALGELIESKFIFVSPDGSRFQSLNEANLTNQCCNVLISLIQISDWISHKGLEYDEVLYPYLQFLLPADPIEQGGAKKKLSSFSRRTNGEVPICAGRNSLVLPLKEPKWPDCLFPSRREVVHRKSRAWATDVKQEILMEDEGDVVSDRPASKIPKKKLQSSKSCRPHKKQRGSARTPVQKVCAQSVKDKQGVEVAAKFFLRMEQNLRWSGLFSSSFIMISWVSRWKAMIASFMEERKRLLQDVQGEEMRLDFHFLTCLDSFYERDSAEQRRGQAFFLPPLLATSVHVPHVLLLAVISRVGLLDDLLALSPHPADAVQLRVVAHTAAEESANKPVATR
eukprot:746300-Hanusia_phi.AAC.2